MRLPFATASGTLADSLNSQRSMNIEMTAAICELIDNSLEHGGRNVWVKLDHSTNVGYESNIEKVIVVDDGNGMDPEKLANHLVIGFHDEDDDVSDRKFGKFGVGAKYAFFNNCTKSEVWSKTENGEWFKSEFDLEDEYLQRPTIKLFLEIAKSNTTGLSDEKIIEMINNKGFGYPKPSIRGDPPAEHRDLWAGIKHGTFVLWTNFDKGELPFGIEELEWNFSRVYRKWIGEKIVQCVSEGNELISKVIVNPNRANIWLNGDLVKAYDPLYRIPFKDDDEISDEAQYDWPPIIHTYQLTDELIEKYGRTEGFIKIQFGLAPQEWRKNKRASAESEENMIQRRIQGQGTSGLNKPFWNSQNVSILRAGREVAYIWDAHLTGTGRSEPTDRWWGLEIDFDESLDDAFNVQNVKSRIGPVKDLKKEIKELVSGTLTTIQTDISDYFLEVENQEASEERRRLAEERRLARIVCANAGGTWSNNRCLMPGEEEEEEEGGETTFVPDDDKADIDPRDVPELDDNNQEETENMLRHIFGDNALVQTLLQAFDSDDRVVHVEDNLSKRVPQDTSMMFEFSVRGSRLLKVRYLNHPYHKELKHNYELLENAMLDLQNHIDGKDLDAEEISNLLNTMSKTFTEIEIIHDYGINSALLGMARTQGADDEKRSLMHEVIARWSDINFKLIDRLTRNRN